MILSVNPYTVEGKNLTFGYVSVISMDSSPVDSPVSESPLVLGTDSSVKISVAGGEVGRTSFS